MIVHMTSANYNEKLQMDLNIKINAHDQSYSVSWTRTIKYLKIITDKTLL